MVPSATRGTAKFELHTAVSSYVLLLIWRLFAKYDVVHCAGCDDANCANCDGDFNGDQTDDNLGCNKCHDNHYLDLDEDNDDRFIECLCEYTCV